jgi:LysM repeat protein
VVRGDTPVSIARKLHVVYDDLIRLNKIEDPKKLKIGLKLKVPVKRVAV